MVTQGIFSSLEWRVQFCWFAILLVCYTYPSLSTFNKEKNLTDQRASLRVDTRDTQQYCSELYSHTATGDPKVLDVPPSTNYDSYPMLQKEVEAAVKSLKKGKSAEVHRIPLELVRAGGEAMIDIHNTTHHLQQDREIQTTLKNNR